jgi:hypothetical protein
MKRMDKPDKPGRVQTTQHVSAQKKETQPANISPLRPYVLSAKRIVKNIIST